MIEHQKISVENLEFDCRISGDAKNPMVVLLHGFPETSVMWVPLMEKLSSLGYFCLAPNMRGYSENACPKGVKNYAMKFLMQDIIGLVNHFNKEQFYLIGHDWGAGVGWNLTYHFPKRVIAYTAMSIPHMRAFRKAIKIDKVQRKKSSYIRLFLIPFLPEYKIRKKDFNGLRRLWKHSSQEDVEEYLTVFRRKRSLSGALNFYRANIGRKMNLPLGHIEQPTLFIWGNKDLAVGEFAAKECKNYINGPYEYVELDAGHWLMQTKYNEFEESIVNHIKKYHV